MARTGGLWYSHSQKLPRGRARLRDRGYNYPFPPGSQNLTLFPNN